MGAILGKIGFDWHVALANLVNFLIILFVLKKFAFGPVGKMIDDRKKKIKEGLENADKCKIELENANLQKDEILKEAKNNAQKIFAESQNICKAIIKDANEKATLDKEAILKQAKLDAEKEKKGSEEALRREAAALVSAGIKKSVESYVGAGKGDEIINAMLKNA